MTDADKDFQQLSDAITIRRLELLDAVAQKLSMSDVARDFNIRQPAVSQQINSLEAALGTKLLIRRGRTMELTESGRRAALLARRLIALHYEGLAEIQNVALAGNQILRLGCSAPQTGLRILKHYQDIYPGARVSLVMANTETLLKKLAAFEVDTVVTGLQTPMAEFHCHLLFEQDLLAMVPADHPLAGQDEIRLEQMIEETLILREKGSYTRALLSEALSRANLEPKVSFEVATREATAEAVVQGFGVSCVLSREQPHDPRLAIRPIATSEKPGKEYLISNHALIDIPPLRDLFALDAIRTPDIWSNDD
ncbi:LysR family transcriptional regulator [Coralliovum pocilloporae]|uniref:LysR family transcriptional regulator n=1 Tax=Coralliovum pocilloporae TaxID=3066369 RepID=UPI003306C4D6